MKRKITCIVKPLYNQLFGTETTVAYIGVIPYKDD